MEIVAPAGEYSKLEAAILGGANSVYLGLKGFGARRKAGNFTMAELKNAIDFAHIHRVKVYLTLNTIFRDSEIEALYENVKTLYEYGIDAFIVQDLGIAEFLKKNFPEAELHGSTQMTISNHIEAMFLKDFGFKRVVLSRELSFEEIKSIKEKVDIDFEIFVSGALCVSYSGNCYLSSFVGGRSGNRGMCAQPCRKKYKSTTGEDYFFSPKDQLMDYEEIEKLNSIGIESIKVEGRMKSEEYVYETVSYYKDILAGNKTRERRVEKIFNRGYSKGYFYGMNKDLVNSKYSYDLGVDLGPLKGKKIKLVEKLRLGDGIVYLDKDYNKLSGKYINKIIVEGRSLKEAEIGDVLDLRAPKETMYIYKNFDKNVIDTLAHEMKQNKRHEPILMKLYAQVGKEIMLKVEAWGNIVEVFGDKLEVAKNVGNKEKMREKLGELGETSFYAKNIEINYDEKAFVSFGMLKSIKREAARLLEEKIKESARKKSKEKWILEKNYDRKVENPTIVAVVKEEWQKKLLLDQGIKEVEVKNFDVAKEKNLSKLKKKNRLVGNIYQMLTSEEKNLILDWNQNITNSYAMYVFNKIEKLDVVCISPELKKEDLVKIDKFDLRKEMVIYGNLRAMYIESDLKEDTLINEQNDEILVKKNELGNTEVYYKDPMNLIPKLNEVKELGFDRLRLEFTFESEDEILKILESLKNNKGMYMPYNYETGVY